MLPREVPKVLGRALAAPFDAFWTQIKAEVAVPLEYIEEGHSLAFGDKGADLSAPQPPEWASLPDDDFAYHVAHELGMMVLRQRGYPRTGTPLRPSFARGDERGLRRTQPRCASAATSRKWC